MTREEAIKILKECRERKLKYTFYTLDEYQAATDMAIKSLEQETVTEFADRCRECGERYGKLLKEKTWRWIPVSEKLPEDGIYLVTVERIAGKPRIGTKSFAKDLHRVDDFSFRKHKCGWYDYDSEYGCWEDVSVIAWMPLPQPYKGESEVRE